MSEKILFVDDDIGALTLLAIMVERAGFQALKATTGADALRIAAKQQPDLIILDLMMPDMDGIEVCRRLRAQRETSLIPIWILSARGHADTIVEAMEAGANDFLRKPILHHDLNARIRRLFAESTSNKNKVEDNRLDSPRTVLIIEDTVEIAEWEAAIIKQLNCTPVVATRGVEGLQIAKTQAPLLIILDMELPDIHGIEVLKALRAAAETAETPVLVTTAGNPRIRLTLKLFHADYLMKPLSVNEFKQQVLAALNPASRSTASSVAVQEPEISDGEAHLAKLLPTDPRSVADLLAALDASDVSERGKAIITLAAHRRESADLLRETPAQDAFWRNVYHNLGSMAETAPLHWGALSDFALALTLPAAEQNARLRQLTASSDNMDIRISAARALGQNRDQDSVAVLQACVTETANTKLVAAALESLGLIGGATGSDDALPVILTVLDSPTTAVRFAAINALAFIGSDAAAKHLRKLLDSANSATRIDAIRALARPESRIPPEIAARMLLVVTVRDRDPNVLHTVAQTVGQLDTPQSDDLLRSLLNHDSDHVKTGARKGIEALARLRADHAR